MRYLIVLLALVSFNVFANDDLREQVKQNTSDIANISEIVEMNGNRFSNFALTKEDLKVAKDQLASAIAASAALDFSDPAVNTRGRLAFGIASYSGEQAIGVGFVKKFSGSKSYAIGIATDTGFDETLIKGQFAIDIGGEY